MNPPEAPPARVLIVDDNADLAGTLRDVLLAGNRGEAPLEVDTAQDGAHALGVARKHGFDVALVDVKLPDGSGVDLIRPLREANPNSEVVLITGFASMDAAIAALRAGAFAMILKSFRPDELITTVRQALTKARLQREREELEGRYRAVVELTDVVVVALDAAGKVALFNRRAASLAGVPVEDAIGRDFLESWIPEGDRPRLREAFQLAREGERARDVETGFVEAPSGVAAPAVTAGGHQASRPGPRRVRWHLSGPGEEGAAGLVYGIGIDVTERRALEKRAADAEALSAMGTLALNLAHEIRNPLNAAVLQLHLLGRHVDKLGADDETRTSLHRRLDIVGDEIARLNRLLTEFLELARPRGIARGPVHVSELVDGVLQLERESAESRGIRVVRELAPTAVAIGDVEKLKQVVINLVVNAMEAMKDGGTLTAVARPDGDAVIIEIRDTGPGIEPAFLNQIFDPFFTTKEAGTGLGLSIVRKIVDQHAGDVRITSDKGGTRVRVRIPPGR